MKNAIAKWQNSLWPMVRASLHSPDRQVVAVQELSISGERVLLALAMVLCSISLLLWVFVRLWLFAP